MIRLAISCDICGAEKKQTNHWFIAYEAGGELRICGWTARLRKKSGAHHLCGQTCLHKLVDEFMAKTIEADRAMAEPGVVEATGPEKQSDPHNDPQNTPRNDVRVTPGIDMRNDPRVDHRFPDPRWIENRSAESRVPDSRTSETRAMETRTMNAQGSIASAAVSASGNIRESANLYEEDEYGSSARLIPTPVASDARPAVQPEAAPNETPRHVSIPWRSGAWERERERGIRSEAGSRRRF